MARLSKVELLLLEYVLEVMSAEDNTVINDIVFREGFNQIFIDIGFPIYSDSTISKAFSSLKKQTILDSIPHHRGAYKVNPIYFVRGSEEKKYKTHRDNLVRKYMEENTRKKLLNRDNL